MQTRLLFAVALIFPSLPGDTAQPPVHDPGALPAVIAQVTSALNEYQGNRGSGDNFELPPLSSAEFDFKTTIARSTGFTLTLLVFKFGTTNEEAVVNDVIYTYSLPAPAATKKSLKPVEPPQLTNQLAKTIQSAAKAVKGSAVAAGLPFSKLTINLQYGVTWEVSASGEVTYSIVTVGLSGQKSKNTIQSVKLVFGK